MISERAVFKAIINKIRFYEVLQDHSFILFQLQFAPCTCFQCYSQYVKACLEWNLGDKKEGVERCCAVQGVHVDVNEAHRG